MSANKAVEHSPTASFAVLMERLTLRAGKAGPEGSPTPDAPDARSSFDSDSLNEEVDVLVEDENFAATGMSLSYEKHSARMPAIAPAPSRLTRPRIHNPPTRPLRLPSRNRERKFRSRASRILTSPLGRKRRRRPPGTLAQTTDSAPCQNSPPTRTLRSAQPTALASQRCSANPTVPTAPRS